jgi:dipeptidyl aminopeptidase/acylaminoacyl peptidase
MIMRWIGLAFVGMTACAQPAHRGTSTQKRPGAESTPSASRSGSAKRAMTVDDVLSIENLGAIVLSPDGDWAAVVIQRSRLAAGHYPRTRLGGDDRADIWLVSTSSGERRRLTDGAADGSGFWQPSWSPDGARLAMLSSRGGDNAHLWVWTRRTGALERAVDSGIHIGSAVRAGGAASFGYVWIDDATILAALVDPNYRPYDFVGDHESMIVAPGAWKKMEAGREPSVSALSSGKGAASRPFASVVTIAKIDVAARRAAPVAEVSVALFGAAQASLSADGNYLAIIETAPLPPPAPGRNLGFDERGTMRVGIVGVGAARGEPRWLESVHPSGFDALVWGPKGSTLALVSPRQESPTKSALYIVDPAQGEPRPVTPERWHVQDCQWRDAWQILVRASVAEDAAPASTASRATARADWWIVTPGAEDPEGRIRRATAGLPSLPSAVEIRGIGEIVGIVGGALWHLDPFGNPKNLTASLASHVRAIVQHEDPFHGGSSFRLETVVASGEGDARTYHSVNFESGSAHISPIERPSPHATIESHWTRQRAVVFKATEDEGVYAWVSNLATGKTTRIAALNEHLADIAPAKRELIEYRGADGTPLQALVLFPNDYQAGRRYPVLTWVYGGTVFRSINAERSSTSKFSDSFLNLLPLLARGYVVLMPSIPLANEGRGSDPMADIPNNVLAAVDRLVELGIADPARLAVGGHSYGGYTTYAIVTATNRFKAAIAADGPTNLVSHFGTLDPRFRYTDLAGEARAQIRWLEGGQGRMGGPPNEDPDRYIRNSPIFRVDRVETPLLIIHGDMDFVPITQAEEFFTGLHRQGKEARFLRYWGEGHSIESAANIRNMWEEIFRCLDTHLGSPMETRPK